MSLTEMKQTVRESMIKLSAMLGAMILMVRPNYFYASTALGTSIETGSKGLIDEIANIYCGSLCFLLIAIDVVLLFISKDDKVIAMGKRALLFLVVAYIILKLIQNDVIKNTVEAVSGFFGG